MVERQPAPARWNTFSTADRESFSAAIARHRRASWRVTAACAVSVMALAVVVAILMAPLLYSLIGLAFDVVNLITPAPDLMTWMGRQLDALLSSDSLALSRAVGVGVIAALPGLALMGTATYALRRIWRTSPLFDSGDLPGRPPNRADLNEERLANIVEEMAIAAGIPVPRVVIVPGGVNAAACGRDQAHVTLLVGEELAGSVDREQLEGLLAHLVGSIADGDMTIGLRVTTTLALFGLVARVSASLTDRRSFRQTAKLWRVFVAPTSANTAALLGAVADPFRDETPADRTSKAAAQDSGLTWREWLLMPLMGPVLLTGFLSGMVTEFLLTPLVSLAWRQRKYMADATAVELTRDPDGLAGGLAAIAHSPTGIATWTAHLAVAGAPRGQDGPFGTSLVPIFPSIEKRGDALVRMGAHITPRHGQPMPWLAKVVLTVLLSIVGALLCVVIYLLVMLSAAVSGLFTIVPAAFLHYLLRWLGH
jgi:Zn-dependent protease with chaperone function